MTMELERYYSKFSEDKRLTRRHGQVEYITTMKYIHDYLNGDFYVISEPEDLYDYLRIEDINKLNEEVRIFYKICYN